MHFKRIIGSILICFILIMVVVNIGGCTQKPKEKTITIGAILPLTGRMAIIGGPERIGAEIAVDKLTNAEGSRIKILFKDSQGSPKIAATLAHEVLAKHNVDALIVSTSACVLAVKPIAEENSIPLFAITSQPDVGDGKTVFRISPNSADETVTTINYAKSAGIQRLALIYPNNDLGLIIKHTAEKTGGAEIVFPFSTEYTVGELDFRILITKLKGSQLDAVFFAGYPFDIPVFARQVKEAKIDLPFYTSMAASWPSATEGLINISLSPVFPVPKFSIPSLRSTEARSFANLYNKKTNEIANYDAAFVYDTITIIHRLFSSPSPQKSLEKRWTALGIYEGVSGTVQFVEGGDSVITLLMATISDKSIVAVEK